MEIAISYSCWIFPNISLLFLTWINMPNNIPEEEKLDINLVKPGWSCGKIQTTDRLYSIKSTILLFTLKKPMLKNLRRLPQWPDWVEGVGPQDLPLKVTGFIKESVHRRPRSSVWCSSSGSTYKLHPAQTSTPLCQQESKSQKIIFPNSPTGLSEPPAPWWVTHRRPFMPVENTVRAV